MRVEYTDKATKELRRIGPRAVLVDGKVNQYAANPASLKNNVKALKGSDTYRLRVGDYRVIFEIENDTVVVLAVRKRGEAYD